MSFLTLRVKTALIVHGYTEDNQEIIEQIHETAYTEKLIALSRILSVSPQYLLVTGSHGRIMYWAYDADFEQLKERLILGGLVI